MERVKPTIVLADDWKHFLAYIREHGATSPHDKRFIYAGDDPWRLRGIEAAEVVEIGHFARRSDATAQQLREVAAMMVR